MNRGFSIPYGSDPSKSFSQVLGADSAAHDRTRNGAKERRMRW